jgi:hypothetical protein
MATPFASVLTGLQQGEERKRLRAQQDADAKAKAQMQQLQIDALNAAAQQRQAATARETTMRVGRRTTARRLFPELAAATDDELDAIPDEVYQKALIQSVTPKKKAVAFDASTGKPYVYDVDNPQFPEGFTGPHQQAPAPRAPVLGTPEYLKAKEDELKLEARYRPPPAAASRPPRPPTEFQQKMGLVLPNAESAASRIKTYIDAHGAPPLRTLVGKLTLGQFGVTSDEQQFRSAAETLLAAILRPETGAAVSESEWDKYAKIFIPMPGDKPALIKQKLEEIDRRLGAMRSVMPGGGSPSAAPSKPSLAERIQQLKSQGISKDAARAQLLKEGYDLGGAP